MFLGPAALVLLAVNLGPMLFALKASFTAWVLPTPGTADIYVGIENYTDVAASGEFWSAVRVTVLYALFSVTCGLTLGTIFALLLDAEFHARSFFRPVMIIRVWPAASFDQLRTLQKDCNVRGFTHFRPPPRGRKALL